MMEIKLMREVPAVIEMNFDEVREQLHLKLENYKDIVVVEENLKDCKADARTLASLKKGIDTFRKDKKKDMLLPISLFESKCNELVSIVELVEYPIREGIKIFDDKKRQQNISFARSEIERIAQELGVEEKYMQQFSWTSVYENMSISKKEITKDIEIKCENLLLLQEKEKIQAEVKRVEAERLENERIKQQEIIKEQQLKLSIMKKEQEEKDIENAKVQQAFEELRIEKYKKEAEEAKILEEINKDKESKKITYILEITGSIRALTSLKNFMAINEIQYKVNK